MTTLTTEGPSSLRQGLREGKVWPTWRKIAFRFAFIYIVLYTTPWALATSSIPGLPNIWQWYDDSWSWTVGFFNKHYFQVAKDLVPFNGSGDTSFGWAQLWFMLCFCVLGTAIWSVIDNKRKNYEVIDYWLRISVRYYISFFCFTYGIIKIFAMQMWFPSLSQLATPLGDYLPMRLSWMFIGYSTPYQVFSGIMETIAGLLLLNRKTVTLGLITATGVFIHVFVLNMAYDIPVKLFSFHLLIFCLYLLSYELKRLTDFFILNRVTSPDTFFNVEFRKKWMRYARVVAKLAFFVLAFVVPLFNTYEYYKTREARAELKPIKSGVYDVDLYVVNNKDTIPPLINDKYRWNDVILDIGGEGSMKNVETLFHERYGRTYFSYKPDTVRGVIEFRNLAWDSLPALTMKYKLPDQNTIQLWSKYRNDSVFMQLRLTGRHFQLAEKQFHWLSEYNR